MEKPRPVRVDIEQLDPLKLLRQELFKKLIGNPCRNPAVWIAHGQIQDLHHGETPPCVCEAGHAKVGDSLQGPIEALIRRGQCAAGQHVDLDLPVGPFFDFPRPGFSRLGLAVA